MSFSHPCICCCILLSLMSAVCFCVVGKPVKLSLGAEEVALFFAQMLDHEYTTKDVFRDNFFTDWRKVGEDDSLASIWTNRCIL